MTKYEALYHLQKYLQYNSFPVEDVTVYEEYEGNNMTIWTFKGLLCLVYGLKIITDENK